MMQLNVFSYQKISHNVTSEKTKLCSVPAEYTSAKLNSKRVKTWNEIMQDGIPRKVRIIEIERIWNRQFSDNSLYVNCLITNAHAPINSSVRTFSTVSNVAAM